MDPLSIIAGVIAVSGAVATVTKILAPVIRLRDAPDQFLQLLNEVSDMRLILSSMTSVAAELEAQGDAPRHQVVKLLEQAKVTLNEISTIMTDKVLVAPETAESPVKISKKNWLRQEGKVRASLKQLRHTKQSIHSLISTHTATAIPRVRLDMQDIVLLSREISASIRDLRISALERLDTMNSSLQPVHSSLEALHSTLQQAATGSLGLSAETETNAGSKIDNQSPLMMKHITYSEAAAAGFESDVEPSKSGVYFQDGIFSTLNLDTSIGTSSRRSSSETLVDLELGETHEKEFSLSEKMEINRDNSTPEFLVKASVYRPGACRRHCACRCHTTRRVKTPRWATVAVGNMFLGYSGAPILSYRSYNDMTYEQNARKVLRISYYFPRWFLDSMVEVTCNWGPLDGHRVSVRAPRLVFPDADVFAFASRGNVEGLRALFARGEASPFDVNALNGRSALNLATMEQEPLTCQFLLQAGANPHETDQIDRSPIDIVWNMMVREGTSQRFKALVKVFKLDIDDGYEYLLTRKYTPLHQIIMELKTHPSHDTNSLLALQLSLSTEDIDAQDSQGRTPLHWAVIKGNAGAVTLLLDAGASISIRDYKKQTPIHLCVTMEWARADCLEPLLFVASRIEREERNKSKSQSGRRSSFVSPLVQLAIEKTHAQAVNPVVLLTQIKSKIWISKLLNDNNEYQGRTPAILATYNDGDDKLGLLLQHGADIELPDFQGRTPLLFAIFREGHKCVNLLLDHGARTDAIDNHGSTILHYAARYGTLEVLQLLANTVRGVDIRAKDKDGNTALQIFTSHRSRAPSKETMSSFQRLMANAAIPAKPKTPHSIVPGWVLGCEDMDSSDVEQFFTAPSSLEASGGNSLETSVDDLRALDGEQASHFSVLSGIKPWIHRVFRQNERSSKSDVVVDISRLELGVTAPLDR